MYVKAEISKEEAREILSQRSPFLPIRIKRKPIPPKSVELMHLPFYLIEIQLNGESGKQKATISLDGLLGSSIFFAKSDLNYTEKIENSICPFVLPQPDAQEKALREYRWVLLEHGLRTKKGSTVEKVTEVKAIFYPFWIGYFQRKKAYDFKAVDGVTGELQGVKMRKIFIKALREVTSP
jgi:hypothetical protein